ncbi:MAG TPA: response regulator [Bryobacteraceae bacterium]|jgi:two-component system response regulator|nr:response regulator [Bryobacteraceae bacterium]
MKPVEVLLVEDNAGDTLLIQQTLAEGSIPVRIHVARDGEQALQMLDDPQFSPGLIILDLNIPRIPGSAVLERYHSTKTPIVIFSSSWNEAEISRAMELGAREFAQKPTDLQAFSDVVCGMVEKWALREEADSTASGS